MAWRSTRPRPTRSRPCSTLKGRGPSAALPLVAASLDQVIERCGALDAASARLAQRVLAGAAVARPRRAGVDRRCASMPARARSPCACRRIRWRARSPRASARRSRRRARTAPASRLRRPRRRSRRLRPTRACSSSTAGPTPGGAPSTIVDARGDRAVLRPRRRDRVEPRARIARGMTTPVSTDEPPARTRGARRLHDDDHARSHDPDVLLDELTGLARAAGAEVGLTAVQARDAADPATLIGRGKAERSRVACDEADVSTRHRRERADARAGAQPRDRSSTAA